MTLVNRPGGVGSGKSGVPTRSMCSRKERVGALGAGFGLGGDV